LLIFLKSLFNISIFSRIDPSKHKVHGSVVVISLEIVNVGTKESTSENKGTGNQVAKVSLITNLRAAFLVLKRKIAR